LGETKEDRGEQTVAGREKENRIDNEWHAEVGFRKLYGQKREEGRLAHHQKDSEG
jgi:hypothetical protein